MSGRFFRKLGQYFEMVRMCILLCRSLAVQSCGNCTTAAVLAWRIYG